MLDDAKAIHFRIRDSSFSFFMTVNFTPLVWYSSQLWSFLVWDGCERVSYWKFHTMSGKFITPVIWSGVVLHKHGARYTQGMVLFTGSFLWAGVLQKKLSWQQGSHLSCEFFHRIWLSLVWWAKFIIKFLCFCQ